MQKAQRTFTREFKVEAVQLVRSSKKPLAHIARNLGIADSTLHHWCQLFSEQGEQAFPGSGHQTPPEEEIRHLKRENDLLRLFWANSTTAVSKKIGPSNFMIVILQ